MTVALWIGLGVLIGLAYAAWVPIALGSRGAARRPWYEFLPMVLPPEHPMAQALVNRDERILYLDAALESMTNLRSGDQDMIQVLREDIRLSRPGMAASHALTSKNAQIEKLQAVINRQQRAAWVAFAAYSNSLRQADRDDRDDIVWTGPGTTLWEELASLAGFDGAYTGEEMDPNWIDPDTVPRGNPPTKDHPYEGETFHGAVWHRREDGYMQLEQIDGGIR